MSTLAVVEEILHDASVPMSVREIVERAGSRLPSKSKTPDTVVARDLAMDIKKNGEGSLFMRTSPGRYALRALSSLRTAERPLASGQDVDGDVLNPKRAVNPGDSTTSLSMEEVGAVDPAMERIHGGQLNRKPAVSAGVSRSGSSRGSAEGGGYAG